MNTQELISQISSIPLNSSTLSAQMSERESFIQKFPPSMIASLSAQKYNGGKEYDSFCYNLEYKSDLPFGIGGRSNSKFGGKNDVSILTHGISAMIDDARNGIVEGLREKYKLKDIAQDVLIKILSIYLPKSFLTIGQEYPLVLLGKILNITTPANDLIALNYKCMKALCDSNPIFLTYEYSRLGNAIWSILNLNKHKAGFEKWLKEKHGKTGTISSYRLCITYLSYFFCENLFSDNISSELLQHIWEDTLKHQKENNGKYFNKDAAPSYGKSGYYSAAVNEYIAYRKNNGGESRPYEIIEPNRYHKNIILYGPPGTGKTYNTVRYAVSIINGYNVDDIKDNKDVIDGKTIKSHFDEYVDNGQIRFTTFHQSLSYEDFIEGIKPEFDDDNKVMNYPVKPGIFKTICEEASKDENKDKNFVLIIDEINRGNVAQIFGELITLIEEDKRIGAENAISMILPYSPNSERFSVPANLYILATMNTADRSVEALDSALRRRFKFIEMKPRIEQVPDTIPNKDISPRAIMEKINKRIEVLKDSEHQIGHSYFMNVVSIEDLINVFRYNVLPLLQEYFFGDLNRIKMVVGEGFFTDPESTKSLFSADLDIDYPDSICRLWGEKEWKACENDPDRFITAVKTLLR